MLFNLLTGIHPFLLPMFVLYDQTENHKVKVFQSI